MRKIGQGPDAGSWVEDDDPGEPSTGHPRLSVTDEEAAILASFAAGRVVYEIGTGLGVSTRALASTAQRVVTKDIDPWVQENIWPTLPANVSTVGKDGRGMSGFHPQMVFIDGDHTADAVRRDMVEAIEVVQRPCLIVCHDVNYENVRTGISFDDRWWVIPTTHGLGLRLA